MSSHEFLCGGDYGSWECLVDVRLNDEEETILKEFAKDDRNEHLDWFPPMDKIYKKVLKELEEQCDDELNTSSIVIWVPSEFKKGTL